MLVRPHLAELTLRVLTVFYLFVCLFFVVVFLLLFFFVVFFLFCFVVFCLFVCCLLLLLFFMIFQRKLDLAELSPRPQSKIVALHFYFSHRSYYRFCNALAHMIFVRLHAL